MASIDQTITLNVTVASLNIDSSGGGSVSLNLLASQQQGFPIFHVTLLLNTAALQYMRNGFPIWPISPDVLTGPGADSLAAVIADIAAAITAGVFNI